MKNIISTDDSVKRKITDSNSENLTDSDLESRVENKQKKYWELGEKYLALINILLMIFYVSKRFSKENIERVYTFFAF